MLRYYEVLRSSEVDWAQSDCFGWYHYQYHTADLREVPPTHRGGLNYPGSKPRARDGIKMSNLFDIKATFDEEDKKT